MLGQFADRRIGVHDDVPRARGAQVTDHLTPDPAVAANDVMLGERVDHLLRAPAYQQVAHVARHFAFITNRTEEVVIVEAEHRDHAVVEQVIADLKDQALAHFPSGEFNANGAWTVLGALAHNLLRWTQLIGLTDTTVRAARTLRRRLITIAGRLTRHGRSWTLHLPARWPWHHDYISALARIRALPAA